MCRTSAYLAAAVKETFIKLIVPDRVGKYRVGNDWEQPKSGFNNYKNEPLQHS